MIAIALPNPLTNPVAFLLHFFYFYVITDPIMGVLKIALFTAVMVYPFILAGDKLYAGMKKQLKIQPIFVWYISGFIMSAVFWFAIRLWSSVLGGEPFMGTVTGAVGAWFAGSLLVLLLGLMGHWLLKKMQLRYDMPRYISYLIIDYIMCAIFWSLATLAFL